MKHLWALLPVKPFAAAKARLAGRLRPAERQALAQAMADDVVAALRATAGVELIVICSAGAYMADWARMHGADFIAEPTAGGLNASIQHAMQWLQRRDADSLLAVHADLPYVSAHDVETLVSTHLRSHGPSVSIAPDRWDDGSNLLAWDLSLNFHSHYGPGSFQKHRAEARRLGAELHICRLTGAAIDIDTEADLDFLLTPHPDLRCGVNTQAFVNGFTRGEPTKMPATEKLDE